VAARIIAHMKTPKERLASLVESLAAALGPNLESVVLYGSAARDDHAGRGSDLNVLVVVTDGSPVRLEPASAAERRWRKDGNPPLLFVTAEWMRNSADVFPIEFTDMLASHRVLHGRDPLEGTQVASRNLRLQCEHDLRSLVLKLRAAYLDANGRAGALEDLVAASFGSVAAVARASLRLAGEEIPLRSEEVVDAAARRFRLEAAPLRAALEVKRGRRIKDKGEMRRVFLEYFDQVAALGRALDALAEPPAGVASEDHRA
jgi:predicted nucleotidyltransferase